MSAMPYRSLAKRVGNVVRLAEVIQILAKHGFADIVRRGGLHEGLPAKVLRQLHLIEPPEKSIETRGARLRAALMELGPTFVKFGQVLSTRPDLIGKKICDDLMELQDRVKALPFDKMAPVIQKNLGAGVKDLYGEFDTDAVASASLSQVYRARTKEGHPVAVKVQRPRAQQTIEADLSLLMSLAEWVTEHMEEVSWMDLTGAVEEFDRSIKRELDFTVEARIIERFHSNYKEDETVFIPQVYRELSARQVLTMDWVECVRLDALAAFPARNCNPKTIAKLGCDTLCKQVFDFRLFHADPHPGNIQVLRDNRIVFLDYGMVGNLERVDVVAIADLLRSIFYEDSHSCVRALLLFTTAIDVEDRTALEHEVGEFIAFEAQAVVNSGELGKAIERVTRILRKHKLQLAPRYSLLLKALATVESSGHQLDPDLDMIPIIRPYVERIVEERFSPLALAKEARKNLSALLRMGQQLPADVQQLLRLLRHGKLKMTMNHEGLDRLANVTDRASNRITFGLIAGSLIIGSSLLMFQDVGGGQIGLAGFVVAGILGVFLLISILRSRNF